MKDRKLNTKSIKTKITLLVILSVLITILLTMTVVTVKSKAIIGNMAKDYLKDVVLSLGDGMERDLNQLGRSALSLDTLSNKFDNYKVSSMDSSYVCLVDDMGYVLFHPNRDLVGSKLEHPFIDSLSERIRSGEEMPAATEQYSYEGKQKYAAYYLSQDRSVLLMITAEKDDAMSQLGAMRITVVLVSLIPLIVCVGIAIFMSSMICRPIFAMADKIDTLSNLDLTQSTEVETTDDEIGIMNSSVNSLTEKLVSTIQSIKNTSDVVDANADFITDTVVECSGESESVSLTMEEIAKGAMEMAESTEGTMNAIVNIGESIEHIAEMTNESLLVVRDATSVGDQSKEDLTKLMEANSNTRKHADDVATGIFEINAIVEEIQKATEMISSISGQTNLLSLNASIEAARAGEAGRGFAVVATEIKGLAEQSSDSADEIAKIVGKITELVRESVALANDIKAAAESESAVLDNVNKSFAHVNSKLEEVERAVLSIDEKVDSVNAEKEDILNEISTLSAISQENAAATKTASESLRHLDENMQTVSRHATHSKTTALQLQEIMSEFKL